MSLLPYWSSWRREALRTNLWLVPVVEVVAAIALYLGTYAIDRAAFNGSLTLPSWPIFGSADVARQILTTLAAEFTLGTFVATFVFATLVLISIGPGASANTFVPHLSISTSVTLVALSIGVLIYFIHHIATSIQLPQVIASIAQDLSRAIDAESSDAGVKLEVGPSVAEFLTRMRDGGGEVGAPSSGYLQFVRHETLVGLAAEKGAVIRLHHRPGDRVASAVQEA
jgi:uncharacterized membrane protein